MYSSTLAKDVSRPWEQSSVARCRICPMSRVCIADRPNSPSKDCCRNRYGSSCLVASVATVGTVTESIPGGVGIKLVPPARPPTAPRGEKCSTGYCREDTISGAYFRHGPVVLAGHCRLAGMPANVVQALNAEIGKMLTSPELSTILANEGALAATMTPQAFGDMMRTE